MNSLKLSISMLLFLVMPLLGSAQNKQKVKELTIHSSIQCGMCTDRLDNMFADYWAVKNVDYDLENQTITVSYNPKKTNEKEIRNRIAGAGYDADDVEAKVDAYLELPGCCRKGAKVHKEEK